MITVIVIWLNNMFTEVFAYLQHIVITRQGSVDIGYTVFAVNGNNGIGTVDKHRIDGILALA